MEDDAKQKRIDSALAELAAAEASWELALSFACELALRQKVQLGAFLREAGSRWAGARIGRFFRDL